MRIGLERLALAVVVVQILVRDHPDRLEPLGPEQAALLEGLQPLGVREQLREQVAAAVDHRAQPAQVVDAEVVEPELLRRQPDSVGNPVAEAGRAVADADHAVAQHPPQRLGDQPGGVGEVDEERVRRVLDNLLGDRHHGRDRSQREREASRAGGLLADHAAVDRDPLVLQPALEAADPDRAVDDVRALHRIAQVGGHPVADRRAELAIDAVQHGRDAAEARSRRRRTARSRRS